MYYLHSDHNVLYTLATPDCSFNRQRVSFRVENELIQGNNITVREQQIQVFQRLSQEEGLHFVSPSRRNVGDVIKRTVATSIDLCVFLKCLKDLPTPFTVSAL